MDKYWLQVGRELIATRNDATSAVEMARWEGRAVAFIAEALRLSGDNSGIEEITNV
jgi:hypothetical protein